MITCTFNVRGVGADKKRRVRELVGRERVEVLAIQETKLSSVNFALCNWLWGGDNVTWTCNPSLQRSGGLLLP
jgi:exonuclease III